METHYISLIDSSEKIPFTLTYGLHRELQEYLLQDERLFKIFTDTTVSDEVVKICLSKRNEVGQITDEFVEVQLVTAEDITELLNIVFEYFSEFFLKNQKKLMELTNNLNQISQQSQPS